MSLPLPGPPCLPGTPGYLTHPVLEPCLSVDSFWKQCLNMLLSLTWSHVFHLPPGSVSPIPRIPGSCVTPHHIPQYVSPASTVATPHPESLQPSLASWAPAKYPMSRSVSYMTMVIIPSYKLIKSIPVYLKLTQCCMSNIFQF